MERFANRDVCDISIVDYATKKPLMYIDYANATSAELTGESVYAYGGHGHVKRVAFSGERAGTLTLETQVQTFQLYQLITGGKVAKAAKFLKREVVSGGEGTLTVAGTPIEGTANVYLASDDCGSPIEVQSVSVNTVNAEGVSNGNQYVVYYMENIDAGIQSISIDATSFPANVAIYGETYMTTESGQVLPYKMVAWKAMAQSNAQFSFSNTGDPATLTITFDLMADSENGDKILDLIMEDGSKE